MVQLVNFIKIIWALRPQTKTTFLFADLPDRSNDGKKTKDFGGRQEMYVSALQTSLEYL